MDKTLAGVIGAISVLAISASAQAASSSPLHVDAAISAGSYAGLVQPDGGFRANPVETVQYYGHYHHHHHWHRRWHRHRPLVVIRPPG